MGGGKKDFAEAVTRTITYMAQEISLPYLVSGVVISGALLLFLLSLNVERGMDGAVRQTPGQTQPAGYAWRDLDPHFNNGDMITDLFLHWNMT